MKSTTAIRVLLAAVVATVAILGGCSEPSPIAKATAAVLVPTVVARTFEDMAAVDRVRASLNEACKAYLNGDTWDAHVQVERFNDRIWRVRWGGYEWLVQDQIVPADTTRDWTARGCPH